MLVPLVRCKLFDCAGSRSNVIARPFRRIFSMTPNSRRLSLDEIVSYCRRKGFIFQASEIYGGINGFWDYGPLGVELKRNIKETWWRDMVSAHNPLLVPAGAPSTFDMAGINSSIIQHPQVWRASGHYDQFGDLMVDCRETTRRYRYDHVVGRWAQLRDASTVFITAPPDAADAGEALSRARGGF